MKKSCSAGEYDKKKMKMRGFMCQSKMASSVICRSSSSVIVPRKIISSSSSQSDDSSSSSCSSARYMRLVESPSLNPSAKNQRTTAAKQASRHLGEQPRFMASILSTPECAAHDVFQVVVMKVSIHCQGCAGKVKKHLSKMEGVTSFSIDVETKRVTVMGHVSPDWVLESLSKVKRAELWTL